MNIMVKKLAKLAILCCMIFVSSPARARETLSLDEATNKVFKNLEKKNILMINQ